MCMQSSSLAPAVPGYDHRHLAVEALSLQSSNGMRSLSAVGSPSLRGDALVEGLVSSWTAVHISAVKTLCKQMCIGKR